MGIAGAPSTSIKMASGIVASNGTLNIGTNVAGVVRNSVGNYTITFNTGYFDPSVKPCVCLQPDGAVACIAVVSSLTVSGSPPSMTVMMFNVAGAAIDNKFSFMAIVDQSTVPGSPH